MNTKVGFLLESYESKCDRANDGENWIEMMSGNEKWKKLKITLLNSEDEGQKTNQNLFW